MPTYTDLGDLCKAVKAIIENKKVSSNIGPPITPPLPSKSAEVEDAEDMVLLNLLYAPRRSRLHSILKVLTRIETAGHILAWTKASALEVLYNSILSFFIQYIFFIGALFFIIFYLNCRKRVHMKG